MMNILLAGGGTAGHINPALAIAREIQKHHPKAQFLFVGNAGAMEETLVAQAGFAFAPMKIQGFQRSLSAHNMKRNVKALWYLLGSPGHSKKILKDFSPDLAIGTGGYVSGPVLYMAAKMGIPTMIHEQNAYPGITTKLLAKKVNRVLLGAKGAERHLKNKEKCILVGNPVRPEILEANREEARAYYGLDEDTMCILSFGGSLGARTLNEQCALVMQWHTKGDENIRHIHATGQYGVELLPQLLTEKGVDMAHKNLDIRTYIEDMDRCLAASDLVISRSGAISVSEIATCGKASILVPSPNVTANHQYYNAKELAEVDGAILIEEKDLGQGALLEQVKTLYQRPEVRVQLGEKAQSTAIFDTNGRIYDIAMALLTKGQ